MEITVYILRLASGTYYTGLTNNLQRRLSEHASGRSKSTRHGLPVTLMHTFVLPDRKTAARLERKIKNRGAVKFLCNFIQLRPVSKQYKISKKGVISTHE